MVTTSRLSSLITQFPRLQESICFMNLAMMANLIPQHLLSGDDEIISYIIELKTIDCIRSMGFGISTVLST